MKLHSVVVTGRGPFPMDMLRYDMLAPKSEHDAALIEDSFRRSADAEKLNTSMVYYLERYADHNWTPTGGRWDSFGFHVIAHTINPYGR